MAEIYTAFIDPNFNVGERRAIGNAIIDYIQNRSKRGLGIGKQKLKGPDGDGKYSNSYVISREYKAAGKTGRRVNLTLTGDMLNSIELLDISLAGRIIIGFENGPENDKARYMREKGYDFLGLSGEELNKIVSKFQKQTPREIKNQEISQSIAEAFLRNLFGA